MDMHNPTSRNRMRRARVLGVATFLLATALTSMAFAEPVKTTLAYVDPNAAPVGGGTEIPGSHVEDDVRVHSGPEISAFVGGGYGLGVGGRLGHTFPVGLYVGGAFTFYTGDAALLGGEVGFKFFPSRRWELRPYLFAGPAFIRTGEGRFARDSNQTVLAIQPGFIGAYHFGDLFVYGDARAYAEPGPQGLALFGGLGVSL